MAGAEATSADPGSGSGGPGAGAPPRHTGAAGGAPGPQPAAGPGLPWRRLLVVLLLGALAWACTWTVAQNEEGVRLRFGRAVGTLPGGLHVTLPWPIERVVSVAASEVRSVAVGVGDEGPRFDVLTNDLEEWLTGDTNLVQLRARVLYTVDDPVRYLYGFAGGEDDGGVGHEALIGAVSEAVFTGLLTDMTVDTTLASGKATLASRGRERVQQQLDALESGLRIVAIEITDVSPPLQVVTAFNDVASAKFERERLIAEARGTAASLIPRARARAGELIAEAETDANDLTSRARGEAGSFARLADEMAVDPLSGRQRLWLEAMERILRRTEERVVPPGSRVYVDR